MIKKKTEDGADGYGAVVVGFDEIANEVGKGGNVVLNLCGRGDKDIFSVAKHLGVEL